MRLLSKHVPPLVGNGVAVNQARFGATVYPDLRLSIGTNFFPSIVCLFVGARNGCAVDPADLRFRHMINTRLPHGSARDGIGMPCDVFALLAGVYRRRTWNF
jgi:hypothetical protein